MNPERAKEIMKAVEGVHKSYRADHPHSEAANGLTLAVVVAAKLEELISEIKGLRMEVREIQLKSNKR